MNKRNFYYYLFRTCLKIRNFFWLSGDFFGDLPCAIISSRGLVNINDIYFNDQKRVTHWSKFSQGLSQCEDDFLKQYQINKGSFLVIACGGGREAFELAKKDLEVTAIDVSEGLIRISQEKVVRENLKNVDFRCVSMHDFKLEKKFDYVFFSGRSYNYVPTRKMRIKLLKEIRTWMNPEGRLLLNFCVGEKPIRGKRKYFLRIYQALAYLTFGNRDIARGDSISGEHYRHDFLREEEAMSEAKEAGFIIERPGSDLFLRPGG